MAINLEQIDQMAHTIDMCGADFEMISHKIQAAIQGARAMHIPDVMEDEHAISSAASALRERAHSLARKLRGKAEEVRRIVGG